MNGGVVKYNASHLSENDTPSDSESGMSESDFELNQFLGPLSPDPSLHIPAHFYTVPPNIDHDYCKPKSLVEEYFMTDSFPKDHEFFSKNVELPGTVTTKKLALFTNCEISLLKPVTVMNKSEHIDSTKSLLHTKKQDHLLPSHTKQRYSTDETAKPLIKHLSIYPNTAKKRTSVSNITSSLLKRCAVDAVASIDKSDSENKSKVSSLDRKYNFEDDNGSGISTQKPLRRPTIELMIDECLGLISDDEREELNHQNGDEALSQLSSEVIFPEKVDMLSEKVGTSKWVRRTSRPLSKKRFPDYASDNDRSPKEPVQRIMDHDNTSNDSSKGGDCPSPIATNQILSERVKDSDVQMDRLDQDTIYSLIFKKKRRRRKTAFTTKKQRRIKSTLNNEEKLKRKNGDDHNARERFRRIKSTLNNEEKLKRRNGDDHNARERFRRREAAAAFSALKKEIPLLSPSTGLVSKISILFEATELVSNLEKEAKRLTAEKIRLTKKMRLKKMAYLKLKMGLESGSDVDFE